MSGAQAINPSAGSRHNASRTGARATADTALTPGARPLPGTALCMLLVALSMVLGGGGTVNPQTEMILQVCTGLIMIPLVASADMQRGLGPVQMPALCLGGLVLLVPVLQLVPLPPSVWHALPGRSVEIQSLALVSADNAWMPLSMAPARTFASLLAMICPVLLMLQVSRLSVRGRNWLCVVIVSGGMLSLVLGVLQLSHTGDFDWSLYSEYSKGFLVGFQANRNAQADVLLTAMLAAGALASARLGNGRSSLLTWTALLLALVSLLIGLIMTGSRTGIALAAVMFSFIGLMLLPLLQNRKAVVYGLFGSGATAIVSAGLLLQLQSVQRIADRFSFAREARWDLWADTWHAATEVWPFGSGIGTIVPMLEAAERLEVVDPTRPVRAHNDWLEWTLEAGLPGLVALGLVTAVLGFLVFRAVMEASRGDVTSSRRAQIIFACGFLSIEALHAIVDYPMRSMSLAMLTAVAAAFLLAPAAAQQKQL